MTRKPLGRGLNALIPDFDLEEEQEEKDGIAELPLEEIQPGPLQPRKQFDDTAIAELADSIRENGVIQPIVVQMGEDKKYEIICGERRWRASQKAGRKTIPAIVREITSTERLQLALIENIHRQDLNPMEEAEAYHRLGQEFALTPEAIAKKVGRNRVSVANHLRLLKLPRTVQAALRAGSISFGHARAILAVESAKEQEALCSVIVDKGLSVREAESWSAKAKADAGDAVKTGHKKRDVFVEDLERKMERALGTKVELRPSGKGGRVVISYYSNDDLTRIRDIILK